MRVDEVASNMWGALSDGDGHIGRQEIKRTFEKFNLVTTPDVLDAVMTRFDHNGDGKFDFNEFVRVVMPDDFPVDDAEKARRLAMINLPLVRPARYRPIPKP
jgi:hypothetical protein